MFIVKIKENISLRVVFSYDRVPQEKKQELKGRKFRRRNSEARITLIKDGIAADSSLVGVAINDSANRFNRVTGRERALANAMAVHNGLVSTLNWPISITPEIKAAVWAGYRKSCPRRVVTQIRRPVGLDLT